MSNLEFPKSALCKYRLMCTSSIMLGNGHHPTFLPQSLKFIPCETMVLNLSFFTRSFSLLLGQQNLSLKLPTNSMKTF